MWVTILEILKNLFSFLKSKKDKELEEFKIKQGEEFKRAKTAQEAANIRDEHEKLVAAANSKDKATADAALAEIRKRLGK